MSNTKIKLHCMDPIKSIPYDLVTLCGLSYRMAQYANWPWNFYNDDEFHYRCEECEKHPDLPLMVLGGLDE